MSAYRVAIDQTSRTIEIRAKYFRNLIVVVAALSLGSIFWSAATWKVLPLTGLLLLLPVSGFFFFLDNKLLSDWRSHLVAAWVQRDIDFRAFCEAVGAIPTLPKETLRSMLATLPSAPDLVAEQKLSSSTREAAAAVVAAIHACRSDAVALKALCAAILSVSVATSVAGQRGEPLLVGVTFTLSVALSGMWLRRRRIVALKEKTLAAQAKPDFSNLGYRELVAGLAWEPISRSQREHFVSAL